MNLQSEKQWDTSWIYVRSPTIVYAITNHLITVWYIPDAIQFVLEIIGLENIGKIIGAMGNTFTGFIFGFIAGGPIGLLFGGIKSFLLWLIGEFIWGLIFEITYKIIHIVAAIFYKHIVNSQ